MKTCLLPRLQWRKTSGFAINDMEVIWPPKKSLRKASLSGRCKKLLQAGGEGLVTKPGRKYTNKCSAITANSG